MIRKLWPDCKILHGKPRHPQSQGSVERVNREIKPVLGSLMRKNKDNSPYRVLFGREPVRGMQDYGIPDEIANDVTIEEEIIT